MRCRPQPGARCCAACRAWSIRSPAPPWPATPLPEESAFWSLTTPAGVELLADGALGLARVIVTQDGHIIIDHALKDGQRSDASARALLVTGLDAKPTVEHFGQTYANEIQQIDLDGTPAWVVPVRAEGLAHGDLQALPERAAKARQSLDRLATER